MTGCFVADATPKTINLQAEASGLYFPLFLEETETIIAHLRHGGHLPASHRFGTLGDNILGINFALPDGPEIRLGGRAIKNCTGFDLTHFILNSRHHFGTVTACILRLRSLPGPLRWFGTPATPDDIERFRRNLNRSPWWHALECVDVEVQEDALKLWVGLRGSPARLQLAEHWLTTEGISHRTPEQAPREIHLRCDAGIKTLPSNTVEVASSLVGKHGGHARIHVTSGYIRWSSPTASTAVPTLNEMRQHCLSVGGHLQSPHLPPTAPSDEVRWITQLEAFWQTVLP